MKRKVDSLFLLTRVLENVRIEYGALAPSEVSSLLASLRELLLRLALDATPLSEGEAIHFKNAEERTNARS